MMEGMPKNAPEERKVRWTNPDNTIGYGTEEEKREALENWDDK